MFKVDRRCYLSFVCKVFITVPNYIKLSVAVECSFFPLWHYQLRKTETYFTEYLCSQTHALQKLRNLVSYHCRCSFDWHTCLSHLWNEL